MNVQNVFVFFFARKQVWAQTGWTCPFWPFPKLLKYNIISFADALYLHSPFQLFELMQEFALVEFGYQK